jgi:hypothetical protein
METKEKYSLSQYLQEFYSGNMDKRELEGKIFQHILTNRAIYAPKCPKDEFVDFLCWLYPRISQSIVRFKDAGTKFKTYIGTTVRYAFREYQTNFLDHDDTENAYWDCKIREMDVCEPDIDYGYDAPECILSPLPPSKPSGKQRKQRVINPAQALFTLLKSYYHVSPDFIAKIAPFIGVDESKITDLIEKLRTIRHKKERIIGELCENIHSQYYRCLSFERRLQRNGITMRHHDNLNDRLVRGRQRLHNMRSRLKSMHIEASNSELASVLGIPKGTVDGVISKVKKTEGKIMLYPRAPRPIHQSK